MRVFAGRSRCYAEPFVVALHAFTFLRFFIELPLLPGGGLLQRLGDPPLPAFLLWGVPALVPIHVLLGLRRAYGAGWLRSIPAAVALTVALAATHRLVCRSLQFALVLALA